MGRLFDQLPMDRKSVVLITVKCRDEREMRGRRVKRGGREEGNWSEMFLGRVGEINCDYPLFLFSFILFVSFKHQMLESTRRKRHTTPNCVKP